MDIRQLQYLVALARETQQEIKSAAQHVCLRNLEDFAIDSD